MKHYPFIDKETNIAGLEPFELALIIGVPFIVGLFLFTILPFGKLFAMFGIFISIVASYIYVRRRKSGKNPGYTYRQVVHKLLRKVNKVY